MDPDELADEADDWVDAGIITREQADAILARYERETARSRVVVALSLMGAALVGVGVLWYLDANWDELSRALRTAILLVVPVAALSGGEWLRRNRFAPRVAHGLTVIGAGFVGASLFLLADLYGVDAEAEWLLLAWAAVVLPIGHRLRSRLTVVLGLALVGGVLVTTSEPADPSLAIGLYGVVLYGIALSRRAPGLGQIEWAYRVGGAVALLVGLLSLAAKEGRFHRYELELTVVALATLAGSVAAIAHAARLRQRDAIGRIAAVWPPIAAVATLGSALVLAAVPDLVPGIVAFVVVHALVLGTIVATVIVGYRSTAPELVNVAAIGLVGQLVLFVDATVLQVVSGASALVVVGLLLLAAGVALERGRRQLLRRMSR